MKVFLMYFESIWGSGCAFPQCLTSILDDGDWSTLCPRATLYCWGSTPFSHRIGLMNPRASVTALEERKWLFLFWELNCYSLLVQMLSLSLYKLLYAPHLDRKSKGTRNFRQFVSSPTFWISGQAVFSSLTFCCDSGHQKFIKWRTLSPWM